MRKNILFSACMAAGLYAAVCGYMYVAQDSLVFPAQRAPASTINWQQHPAEAEVRTLTAADGTPLRFIALYGLSRRAKKPHGAIEQENLVTGDIEVIPTHRMSVPPLLFAFHGNAQNAEELAQSLYDVYGDAFTLIVPYYRGYAGSAGRASEQAVVADALHLYDALLRTYPPAPVYVLGYSIGSGVAVQLAANRRVDELILVTPFDSLLRLAKNAYPYLPVSWLSTNRFESTDYAPKITMPVHILRAETDAIVPPASTNALAAALPTLRTDTTIAGSTHGDIFNFETTGEQLQRILTPPSN